MITKYLLRLIYLDFKISAQNHASEILASNRESLMKEYKNKQQLHSPFVGADTLTLTLILE